MKNKGEIAILISGLATAIICIIFIILFIMIYR